MSNFIRMALFWPVVLLFFACKKEKVIKNEDKFVEQTEQLSALRAEVSAAGYQFVEVSWNVVKNTNFKTVNYTVYLDDQKIIDGLTTTKYSLINLEAGKTYTIKITASTKDGKQIEQIVKASTLWSPVGESPQNLYQEYNIHDYSQLTGFIGLQKLSDGGHLIASVLQHPNYFADGYYKIVVFRTDKFGRMLWYRLLSDRRLSGLPYNELLLTLHKGDKEGVLFVLNYAVKFATDNGEVLLEKYYEGDLKQQVFNSVYYASPQQIIVGSLQGNLFSVNPENLAVTWRQANVNRVGAIGSVQMDSKKNIYYIFRYYQEQHSRIIVHKCNANGEFIQEFLFDGTLPNEYDWGFWMTSLLVDDQDNLYLFGHNSSYNYLRYFKFNTDGTVLKKNQHSDYLLADKSFFNDKGEIVVMGQINGGSVNAYTGVYVFDKDLNIKSKSLYSNIPSNIARGITGNPDGSYNIFLYMHNNPNFIFIKTDANGKI